MKPVQRLLAIWQANRIYPLLIGLLVLVTLGVYLWLVFQVEPQLSQLEQRYFQLQEQSRHARQLEADLESPQNLFQKRQTDLKQFLKLVPSEKEFPKLIAEIFGLADQAGLDIVRVSYTPTQVKGQDLLEYGLAFSVNGDYAQLKKFVYLLEKSKRLISIDSLALNSDQKEDSGISLQLKLVTYFQVARS